MQAKIAFSAMTSCICEAGCSGRSKRNSPDRLAGSACPESSHAAAAVLSCGIVGRPEFFRICLTQSHLSGAGSHPHQLLEGAFPGFIMAGESQPYTRSSPHIRKNYTKNT